MFLDWARFDQFMKTFSKTEISFDGDPVWLILDCQNAVCIDRDLGTYPV